MHRDRKRVILSPQAKNLVVQQRSRHAAEILHDVQDDTSGVSR
jgi:hypothetical protein